MFQSQILYRQADVARLLRVQEVGFALVYGAEPATARADISEDKESSGTVTPALADVRTARLFANGVKAMVSQNPFEAEVAGTTGGPDFDPIWMSSWHNSFNSA